MSTWAQSHSRQTFTHGRGRERWHGWALDVKAIYDELRSADRPLSVSELQATVTMSRKHIHRRLDDLITNGDVRRREDGPDGRVSYYEPISRVHVCDGDEWLPRPVYLK